MESRTKLDEAKARWGMAESIKGEGLNVARPWVGFTPPPHAPAMPAEQIRRAA